MSVSGIPIPYVTLDRRNPSFTSDSLTIPDDYMFGGLAIDRTVPNGLNFQSSDVELQFDIEISLDGGAHWDELAGAGTTGGINFDKHTSEWAKISAVSPGLFEGTGRLLRAVVSTSSNLSPAFPIAIAGSLVVGSDSISFPQ
jgi:hypothetical protein